MMLWMKIERLRGQSVRVLHAMALAVVAWVPGTAAGQEVGPTADAGRDVEEVLVTTARKRRESLYETPAALSVLGTDTLQSLNVGSLDDVAKYVPSLNITRFGVGNTSQAAVFIRGIGVQDHLITTDPGVGVYLDGVYLGRQMGNNLALINVERVEVLRGPQGTLYGRNTLGGAVNIVTRQPGDEEGVLVRVNGGTRRRFGAEFYGNFPVAERFSVSATGGFTRRDGVGRATQLANPEAQVGEINQFSGRVAALWEPLDELRMRVSVDGMVARNGVSPYTIEIIGPPEPNQGLPRLTPDLIPARDDTATNVAGLETSSNEGLGVALSLEWDVASAWRLSLLGSYRTSDYSGGLDDDGTVFNLSEFPERGQARQYSAELQLNGEVGQLDVVGGLYFFNERGSNFSGPYTFAPFNSADLDAGDFFRLRQETFSYAAYVNLSYAILERFKVGGGARYSRDDKDASALFPSFNGVRQEREATFDAVTWDVNASYSFDDNMSVYAQVQRGYQSGGFPPRPFEGPDSFVAFDEITAVNYELGFKGAFTEALTLFASAFWTSYDDLALPFSQPSPGGFVTVVENAGASRAVGFELEGNLRWGGFYLNPALGFIDAEITEVEPGTIGIEEGASPALTPRWTVGANAGYFFDVGPGAVRAQADYSFRDAQFGQSVESETERMDARNLVGFSVAYFDAARGWELELYGKNIFNEVYDQGRLNNRFHGFVGVVLSNDRSEFGLRLTKRFGDL